MRNFLKMIRQIGMVILVLPLIFGCAGPHIDVTREMGISPPKLWQPEDFYEDAAERCKHISEATKKASCTNYWSKVIWAADYKSYYGTRAVVNRNIIYLGGAIALASASTLVGLAAFNATGSDAYTLLPITGTFLGGLLGFSQNDLKAEVYQTAEDTIFKALIDAEIEVNKNNPDYNTAGSKLLSVVGNAVVTVNESLVKITQFQAMSEAEQFKKFQGK